MRALLCLLVACSSTPKSSAPHPSQSTVIVGGAVTFTAWNVTHVDSLFFTDGGQRLVAAAFGSILEIDPIARKQVGSVSLSSATVIHPAGRPGVGDRLGWEVRESIWAWDAGGIIGVANLSARGDAPSGMSVWRPARGDPPQMIPAPIGYLCEPLAVSHDHKALVTRVDTSKRGCGPTQTGAQVFSATTLEPLGPPIELGFTRRAAFSRDGRYVVASGVRELHVMDLREGKVIAKLPIAHELTALAFHPKGNTIAWTNDDRMLLSWTIGEREVVSHELGQGIAFSPDGRFAATNRNGKVILLDATTFATIGDPLEGLGESCSIRSVCIFTDAIAFSDDSTQLAVAISGTQIGVWQLEPRATKPFEGGWLQQLRPLPTPKAKPFPKIDRDGRLDGRVTIAGKPLPNAVITLEAHHQEYDDARALPKLTTQTKADGSYLFENVPTITWSQLVIAPGATRGGYVIDMRTKTAHRTDVALEPAVTIRGKVVDPDNAPAANVRIFHLGDYGTEDLDIAAGTKGQFVIDHVRPATKYALIARRADGAVRSMTFDISKPGPIDATLKLVARTDPSVVHFSVVDKSGAPVAGARVLIETQAAKADANGKVSIDVDTSLSGAKNLRAQVVGEKGTPMSEPVLVNVPSPKLVELVAK